MAWSKRRLKRDARYQSARRDVFERADGRCELRILDACTGRCEQIHHIGGRGGPDPHRLDNLIGCCLHCHNYVHQYPSEAYDSGWSIRKNGVQP